MQKFLDDLPWHFGTLVMTVTCAACVYAIVVLTAEVVKAIIKAVQ